MFLNNPDKSLLMICKFSISSFDTLVKDDNDVEVAVDVEEAFVFEEAIDAQPMPVVLGERIKQKKAKIYACIVIYIAICNVLYICS